MSLRPGYAPFCPGSARVSARVTFAQTKGMSGMTGINTHTPPLPHSLVGFSSRLEPTRNPGNPDMAFVLAEITRTPSRTHPGHPGQVTNVTHKGVDSPPPTSIGLQQTGKDTPR